METGGGWMWANSRATKNASAGPLANLSGNRTARAGPEIRVGGSSTPDSESNACQLQHAFQGRLPIDLQVRVGTAGCLQARSLCVGTAGGS